MAESAVTFVLDRIVLLLDQELKLLRGVRGELEYIKDELQSIRGFLRDADAKEESEEAVKAWVDQVRNIAYDIEDILDGFMLCLPPTHQRHGFIGSLHKAAHFIKDLRPRRHLATQIQDIKARVHDVSERRKRYDLKILDHGESSNSTCHTWHDLRGDALLLEENELVGIHKPREKLIGWLVEGESRLELVSVYGMGGSGKTTLIKKIYNHQRVKEYFQLHAWINVSQSFKVNELLKKLIKQLWGEIKQPVPQGVDTMDEIELKTIVKDFLHQMRYVVVLDDIWSIHAWEAIKYALPDSNCGSRIMVTTRSFDIASYCKEHYGHVYNLESLDLEDSRSLFYKKAFGENSCPPELQGLSQNILKRCGGLPLAIVTIGGVLSTKEKIVIEWEKIYRGLGSLLEINDKLENMKNILSLSYNDLPYNLKPCFLYLGFFPEDYIIGSSRLIKMWIAEGFVREKERMTVEEIAESHLYELINRSLIQVAETSSVGRVKRCRVHDFIREIILSELRDQNFGTIAVEHSTKFLEKVRRLSIHNSVDNVPQNKSFSYLRSLFMFGVDTMPKSYVHAFISNIRLLRVLDLRYAPLQNFPNEIVNLFHLRYLSLRSTKIKKLPKNIWKLKNLETLDLKDTNVRELPSELFKLQWLRSLQVYNNENENSLDLLMDKVYGFDGQVGIGSLVNLLELLCINVREGGGAVRELGRLSQLRRLSITELRTEDGTELCSSVEKMRNLRTLFVASAGEDILDLQFLSSPPLLLQQLYLVGYLEKSPTWISSLENLKMIFLKEYRLMDNLLGVLQDLPNLMVLRLDGAHDGEELCFKVGGFPTLRELEFTGLERLKFVIVEEGAMPHLEKLYIRACDKLEKVPLGIECLANLKVLDFYLMSSEFEMSLNPNKHGGDYWKVSHIPSIISDYHILDGHVGGHALM
ncbi:hypothetical protein HHK36_020327 [Tetracentron sinense]|uniref:Disease resistance protein RPM1-like n=1 Tax=Tetracentron sinense TaxID=13715 RepID=A0A834YTJ1_TETSI|nr:hypothetical protein HHK36_020327 [Tetracentron sinense]